MIRESLGDVLHLSNESHPRWPLPIEPVKIRNFRFIDVKLTKLIYKTEVGGSEEEGSQCDDSENYSYNEVGNLFGGTMTLIILYSPSSALKIA